MADKIVVPEGMLKAAAEVGARPESDWKQVLEAALRWFRDELQGMTNGDPTSDYDSALEDVKRMFLAPEPEIPDEIKGLLCNDGADSIQTPREIYNWNIIEAFRRGQRSGG